MNSWTHAMLGSKYVTSHDSKLTTCSKPNKMLHLQGRFDWDDFLFGWYLSQDELWDVYFCIPGFAEIQPESKQNAFTSHCLAGRWELQVLGRLHGIKIASVINPNQTKIFQLAPDASVRLWLLRRYQRQCRHSCLAGSRRPSIPISIFQGSCGGLALGGHTTRQRASLSMAFRGSANGVWWGIATVGRKAAHFCSCSFSIAVF